MPARKLEIEVAQTVFLVLSTCPAGAPAEALATALVAEKLAACVNVLPSCRSIYRWRDKIEQEEESLLLIKTTGERLAALESWVSDHHPYEVPELLALPVASGLESYLDWVSASVAG